MFKKFLSIFIVSSLTCFLFISCSDSDDSPESRWTFNDGEGLSSSIKLLKEKFKEDQNNLVVSGLSLDYATCMLANGATGQSLQELESFFEKNTVEKTNKLSSMLETIKNSGTLEVANSIWGNRFQEQYKTDMKNKLDAEVLALPDNTKVINDWIAEKTHNKIQQLLEEQNIVGEYPTYLVNAIFFKGLWTSKFDTRDTMDREFTTLEGSKIQVPTMFNNTEVDYATNEDMESIRLTYQDGGIMSIYLPKEGVDFNSFIQGLSKDKLLNMEYTNLEMDIFIPKFEIESTLDVKAIMESLNIHRIFDPTNTDFSVMTTDTNRYVTAFKQKATIKIDEEGTEAAAATEITLDKSVSIGEDITFRANRPFLFYVSEGDFLGVYTGK